jgi:large-conductance mechanosensitive channel
MTPIVQLYCLRVVLGVAAGAISAALAQFVFGYATGFTPLINCITIAIAVYIVTYYILRMVYKSKIEQQSKILSTGIGIYFFAWLAFLLISYTAIQIYLV